MSDKYSYSDEEMNRYFSDPGARHGRAPERGAEDPSAAGSRPTSGIRGYFHRRFEDPKKARAAVALSAIVAFVLICTFITGAYVLVLSSDMPSVKQLENPNFQLATVAYTADGQVLAHYALQNRSWATIDEISPHVTNALVAAEDHRFYNHWGLDMQGILAAIFDTFTTGDLRGASTITQQLARNLYNEQIGFEVSIGRKLKEAVTAIQLERRYTKREILEMYLNTVGFNYNAYGIESAAHTYYGVDAEDLDPLQAATLVGMLRATSYYNPISNPENAQHRRNVVLSLMVQHGFLSPAYYEQHKDDPVVTDYHSSELSASLAPYFAEYVRGWMKDWAQENGYDFYEDGLRVYTTLNAEMQEYAAEAVQRQMRGLQAVVDYEWSRPSNVFLSNETGTYLEADGYTPFEYFWSSKRELVREFIRETDDYEQMRAQGVGSEEALTRLLESDRFMDSLRTKKTRLEAGLVAMDPRSGYVKAWVGGRNFEQDKYDKVAIARRQPGSTFKPFVYTAAIDNGYSPYYTLPDSTFSYRTETGDLWTPANFGGTSGQMKTLAQGLATSLNTITARVMTQLVNPQQVAFYARRMGIRESPIRPVPSLALGTSGVTLLELTAAYSTLANGGLYYEPTVVTRIEDRSGNVLYEDEPAPEEALSEATAYTVVDMMRGVIDYGTGQRIRWQWGLGEYDLAGKTGTTQESADGWFMLMHPQLVTGAWVGFNDRRITFRSNFWGQGAHNALFIVGDFFSSLTESAEVQITNEPFPLPEVYGGEGTIRRASQRDTTETDSGGRVGW